MTPEEKAKELFDKFHYQICNDNGISESESTIISAKQCALICCEEMTSTLVEINNIETMNVSKYGNFWQSVKTEINKL